MANGELTQRQEDFTAQFYDEVNNVIGGDNPNQKLTLLLPGIALTKEDFEYDYKNHAEKGPTVEANESRLANKLYDPYHINGADNGRMLPHQYKSALDALTPKLNPEIARSKNTLRDLLLTKYPYKFNSGSDKEINTFQEVFFRLYNDYIEKLEEWTNRQEQERKRIESDYNYKTRMDAAADDEERKKINIEVNNAYLTWYENNANSAFTAINQKMSTLLSVFSENDMKIIEGILDSGSGAELQEARATMRNLRKLTPDGGYIYPVKFNPTNWFEMLDTSFKPMIDLIDSPAVIYEKIYNLMKRKMSLLSKINAFSNLIPTDAAVKKAADDLSKAEAEYETAFSEMEAAGPESLKNFMNKLCCMVCAICLLPNNPGSESAIESVVKPYATSESGLIGTMQAQGKKVTDKVSALNSAISKYTSALSKNAEISRNTQLAQARDLLQAELDEIEFEIKELGAKAELAQGMNYSEDVSAQAVPEGFSSFYIAHGQSSNYERSEETTTVTTKTTGKGFWIIKKKKRKTETESTFSKLCEENSTEIEIGMNIAKVGIEREWFNPGVFSLTDDMYHLTSKSVSGQFTDNGYNPDDYILPCFPVAMLLARDVTIKLNVSDSSFYTDIHEAVSEASTSKSFIFYNAGNGSKTTSKESETSDKRECMSIIIKIPTPQIIGYYLENTPEDKSLKYDESTDIDNIRKYVAEYMSVINKKMKELEK